LNRSAFIINGGLLRPNHQCRPVRGAIMSIAKLQALHRPLRSTSSAIDLRALQSHSWLSFKFRTFKLKKTDSEHWRRGPALCP